MSWLRIRTKNGVLKVKPRWQMRYEERTRRVPVFDLGVILITWWPTAPVAPNPPARPAKLSVGQGEAQNLLQRQLGAEEIKASGTDPK